MEVSFFDATLWRLPWGERLVFKICCSSLSERCGVDLCQGKDESGGVSLVGVERLGGGGLGVQVAAGPAVFAREHLPVDYSFHVNRSIHSEHSFNAVLQSPCRTRAC